MPAATATLSTRSISGADADVMSALYPVPGLGFIPINAFLLHAREPVLVDCGAIVLRDQYLAAIESLIDLDDLRWIFLTHPDPDHVGCLHDVIDAAPEVRIITTFLGFGRLGLYGAIAPERVYLLNPGQRLSVGDRELEAVGPITFDAPETTAFVDVKTGTLFSADSFGGVVAGAFEHAGDMSAAALRDGVVTWTCIDSPWLRYLDEPALEAAENRMRALAPPIILSSHLPPAVGMLDTLLEHVAAARTHPPYVGPDQAALTALLASLGAQPASAEHADADAEHAAHA